jgi:DNA-binding NarL/FixJ family response regulator
MKRPIHIGMAEDHLLFRQGVIALLKEYEEINILFDVGNGKELLDILKTSKPDIVLLDIEMPVMNGKEALAKIQEKYPNVKVIMISMHYDDAYITEYIINGAVGFLPKNCDIEKIVDAIYAVYEQGYYFDSKISKSLVVKLMKADKVNPTITELMLSEREIEVLKLTCLEKTNQEMSEELFISKRTVEGHRKSILKKTNAKNVVGLVMYAIKHKIIPSI